MAAAKKRKKGRFVGIPYHVVNTPQFSSLSAKANKLLIDLLVQYTGSNNGALSACFTLMKPRGWKSSSTVYKAKKELLDKGFIVVTKTGMKVRGHPTLLAITWNAIDECPKVIFDEHVKPSVVPLSYWSTAREGLQKPPELKIVMGGN
jgi:hypothetical protein